MTRVYVAGTLPQLVRWARDRAVTAAGATHAVTPSLSAYFAQADTEELEYAAMVEAAESSLRLLAQDPSAPPRRVVAAVDAALSVAPSGGEHAMSAVLLPGPVPLRDVVSFHIDEAEAEADVRAATGAIGAADAGDEAAQLLVDQAEVHDLLWFDVSELDQLVGAADE